MKLAIINLILFCLSFTLLKAQSTQSQLTYKYFKDSLRRDMKYNAIVDKFGKPDKDIGSGIFIYVYTLTDSTRIMIGYTDKILYVRHVDLNYKLINKLME